MIMSNENINKQQNGYKAFYSGKNIEVYANTLYEAKQKAVSQFQSKSRRKIKSHMVSVMLCEKAGEQVIHSTSIL